MTTTTLKISSNKLLSALDKCIKWVDRRSIIVATQGVLVSASDGKLLITASDVISTDITMILDIDDTSFKTCIPAHQLYAAVVELAKSAIDVTITVGKKITICGGSHTTDIVPFDPTDFPVISDTYAENWQAVDAGALSRAIRLTSTSSDQKSPFPALSGIYFNNGEVVSIDGVRVACVSGVQISDAPVLLDGATCTKVASAIGGESGLSCARDSVRTVFKWPRGIITSTEINGTFPDYNSILRKESETEYIVPRQDLQSALRMGHDYAVQSSNLVILELCDGLLTVKMFAGTGSHISSIESNKFKGPNKKTGISIKYLADAVSKIDTEDISVGVNDETNLILLSNEIDYRYGIMPMHVAGE